MFTVAIVGPDGAGKSTLLKNLQKQLDLPSKVIYMGVNPEATTHSSPTWRLHLWLKRTVKGKKSRSSTNSNQQNMDNTPSENRTPKTRNPLLSVLFGVKSMVFMASWMTEEWYRQAVSWYYTRRGYLVLFDRHFYIDHQADRIINPDRKVSRTQKFHDTVLEKHYPRPQMVIYLDAPSDILFARKGESTPEELERKREVYTQMAEYMPHFEIVDATLSSEEVAKQSTEKIMLYYKTWY